MNSGDKLRLSENHRRVVSVLFRGVEQMCDSVVAVLAKESGIFIRLEDDLSFERRGRVLALVEQLRGELRRLDPEIGIQPSVESPRRTVRALVSAMTVELEERKSPGLAGYGPLAEADRTKLDAAIDWIVRLLEEMMRAIE